MTDRNQSATDRSQSTTNGSQSTTNGSQSTADGDSTGELPPDLVSEVRRLTRLARRAVDDDEAAAYREDRDERLAAHDFVSRVRTDDDTLVLYPEEWIVDGTVRVDRVTDTSRAYELTLSGPGDPDEWDDVEDHNAAVVAAVGEQHGDLHRRNARAFADFVGNHYAKEVEAATGEEVREFLTEYYPRNAWPTDAERAVVRESLQYVFAAADATPPSLLGQSD